ncbi:MAG: hypothetical protein AAGM21_10080 [Pseudomonadota bacterium]
MPIPNKDHPQTYPSLTLDWEAYAAMLEDCDATPEQQRELIEALWSIVVAFVDLGFDVQSPESCGEAHDPLSDDPPDLLHLLVQEQMNQDKEDTW